MEEAKKAIYRGVVHAAVVWGVDRERATRNPVFWRDGALNYVSHLSHDEDVFAFLRRRGIMSEGFNNAHRLNFTFEQLDDALDTDFSRGIDFEVVLGLMLLQLADRWGFLGFSPDAGPYFLKGTQQWATEVREIFCHLAEMGYLTRISAQTSESRYQWTPKAAPVVKKYLHIDIDV